MARIAGVDLQDNWKVDFALTQIRGIGWSMAKKIIQDLTFLEGKRIGDLTNDQLAKLANKVDDYPIEGDLIRVVKGNVERLKAISAYRGLRHGRSLPVRGQRTRRNARTKRGKRKTVGAFKKEMLAKEKTTEKAE